MKFWVSFRSAIAPAIPFGLCFSYLMDMTNGIQSGELVQSQERCRKITLTTFNMVYAPQQKPGYLKFAIREVNVTARGTSAL